MKRRTFTLLASLIPAGCGRISLSTSQRQATHSVVLVDTTVSMKQFRPQMIGTFSKIAGGLRPGDSLELYAVTENPMAEPPIAIIATPRFDSAQATPALYLAKTGPDVTRQTKEAVEKLKVFLDTPPSSAAALIDGLEVSARSFRSYPAPAKRLYLLTDLQEDYGYAQLSKGNLNKKSTEQIIESIKTEGRLPDLNSVEAYVIGSRIHRESPRMVEDQLEHFWIELFTACGAHTTPDHFGPYLRRFPASVSEAN